MCSLHLYSVSVDAVNSESRSILTIVNIYHCQTMVTLCDMFISEAHTAMVKSLCIHPSLYSEYVTMLVRCIQTEPFNTYINPLLT